MSLADEILQSIKFVREHHGWKAVLSFLILPFIEDISGFILVGSLKDTIPPVPPTLPLEIREATERAALGHHPLPHPPLCAKTTGRCAVGLLDER
jgi:hypothetical protein